MSEKVDANPTKEFFISMLTRDISLTSSIIDLVDNSVDAATVTGEYRDKFIKLELSEDRFHMIDNCGGIPLIAAKEYAFKFGRPDDAPLTPHSVGRFGVGMKRALFKFGRFFRVISQHRENAFQVHVNVDDWLADANDWRFDMDLIEAQDTGYGTEIIVENLYDGVATNFSDPIFCAALKGYLERAHFKTINQGFRILVNSVEARLQDIQVLTSDELSISHAIVNFNGVRVTIKAGVSDRALHDGGWNIICNGRLIEYANKSPLTGWSVDGIRAYHPDFAFFRGVIEFEGEDGALLPWNTTKTGIDTDNPVYRSAFSEIKSVMRPILQLLNDRVKEQENHNAGTIEATPIADAIASATHRSIFEIDPEGPLVRPEILVPRRTVTTGTVSYQVPLIEIEEVKQALGVTTNREVGLTTFRYFRDNEL
jgi:hypothetical protein